MIEVALMVEGQNGLNWSRWQRIVRAAEDMGFAGLYRSDHYTNANPPDLDSLELWVSLTWLASNTSRIEFGPLVSPVSFRHPTTTARVASAIDDLSGGRLTLGLGAGWQEREHHNFGRDLLEVPQRFQRFEEGLEVITRLLNNDDPSSYEGDYFQLRDAILLPRPERRNGPPILIGGNGRRRTLPLAARFASEWNAVYIPAAEFAELNNHLDLLLQTGGRNPAEVRRSLMTRCELAESDSELERKFARSGLTADQLREKGLVVGTPAQMVEQLAIHAEAGVGRIMLQWIDLDDLSGLELIANSVLPQVSAG